MKKFKEAKLLKTCTEFEDVPSIKLTNFDVDGRSLAGLLSRNPSNSQKTIVIREIKASQTKPPNSKLIGIDLQKQDAIGKQDTAIKLDDAEISPFSTPKSNADTRNLDRFPTAPKDLLEIARSSRKIMPILEPTDNKVNLATLQWLEPFVFLSRSSLQSDGSLQYSISAFGSNTSRFSK